ncbi:MAG: L-serine ammonia-lyase, iron-sulfur-dependent, subunit alpha [Pirellulaceae bacterium]
MKTPPSIFNDVLGPVMRGPSSSHSAAANRIGRLARQLVDEPIRSLTVTYDPNGSLVTTHRDQGSDMGLYSGILGWTPDDPRLPTFHKALETADIGVDVVYASFDAPHPNFYRLELVGQSGSLYRLDAISTGGGMIELLAIDRCELNLRGDLYHTLFWSDSQPSDELLKGLQTDTTIEFASWHAGPGCGLLNLASSSPLADVYCNEKIEPNLSSTRVRQLSPVLPVLSRRDMNIPFETCREMLEVEEGEKLNLWELAARYEAARGGIALAEVMEQMLELTTIMENAVQTGLGGTSYEDRILPAQSPGFLRAEKDGRVVPADFTNRIIRYVTAIMEVKSSMGVIVAAPTAGACGAMPGAVLAVADQLQQSGQKKAEAMLVAGLIGVFIARDSTFAAEEGGCMAECGSGSAMAAAAIVHLMEGTLEQQLAAASMALQSCFGMICDPIANRVEAPCLGKNVMAANNALASANMALAGFQHLIPLDEVIYSMNEVARQIPRELCCTALGGLSTTPTSLQIAESLARKSDSPVPASKIPC